MCIVLESYLSFVAAGNARTHAKGTLALTLFHFRFGLDHYVVGIESRFRRSETLGGSRSGFDLCGEDSFAFE
jgi:hypothetical protein